MTRLGNVWNSRLAAGYRSNGASQTSSSSKPTVLLVHGCRTDGSSWSDVISRLQDRGFTVVSVQLPLTSLAEDVAARVYVSAFAPDIGESVIDLQGHYAPPAYARLMISDAAGFLWFPQSAFGEYVAQDIPRIN